MSVSHAALATYGLYFGELEKLINFLKEQEVDFSEDDELDVIYSNDVAVKIFDLNSWTGDEWLLGLKVKLGEPAETYEALWQKAFPNGNLTPTFSLDVMYS